MWGTAEMRFSRCGPIAAFAGLLLVPDAAFGASHRSSGEFLPPVSSFTVVEEVRYADDADPDHVMSVWTPDGTGPFPALVLIHGGGWTQGDRTGLAKLGAYYASRGIASFSIDYQKSSAGKPSWPTTVQDVVCAVRHIKANAARYRIDPNRVAALGFSAGGHLASLLGTLQGDEPFLEGACGDRDAGSRIVLAVSYSGPVDLVVLGQRKIGAVAIMAQFLGAPYENDAKRWISASPHSHISGDDAVFVIAHGTADDVVPQESALSFARHLDDAGVENHLVLVDGAGHGGLGQSVRPVLEPLMLRLLRPPLPGGGVRTIAASTPTPTPAPESSPSPRSAAPKCSRKAAEGTITCDNGILRVRTTPVGITWFDFYHPSERRWYVNKNNLNHRVLVEGSGWLGTELDKVTQAAEILSQTPDQIVARLHFTFPHGARTYLDMTMRRGSPLVRFEMHQDEGSAKIGGVFWVVTFGQGEAVSELHFDGNAIVVEDLPSPLPGGSLEAQHVQWFSGLEDLNFTFSGEETAAPDPANPKWMTRVLGLKQHVVWGVPMRDGDKFAFEARDKPWQRTWGVPEAVPWIEGLWFVRQGDLLEGDWLTYGIDNLEDYR